MRNTNVKVRVIKWDVNWLEIKNRCRKTIAMGDSKVEPTKAWKRDLLLAEHSPLRHSFITIEIDNVPFYVMGHLVRHHVGVTPYVTTSRGDRTNVDRSTRKQTDLVSMQLDMNVQSLINVSRKRLCNQADVTTQIVWLEVIKKIASFDEDVAWACVPEGIRSCGCPEKFGNVCNACEVICSNLEKRDMLCIEKRYDEYNRIRNKLLKKELVKCKNI